MVLITSINEPLWAFVCASGLVFGRVLYAIGYRLKGPPGRIYGAIIVDIALIGVFVGAIVSLVNWDLTSKDPRILPIGAEQFKSTFKV